MIKRKVKTWKVSETEPDVQVGDLVQKYDRTFEWTKHHLTARELNEIAQHGDPLADAALPFLEAKGKSRIDSMENLIKSPNCPPEVKAFYEQVNTIPEWVDFDQIARGQAFYWEMFFYATITLEAHSLISDFTVSSIVGVLTCTGYLASPKSAFRRSVETAFMVNCAMQRNQLKPGGSAWRSIIETRLMHAQARRHVNKIIKRDAKAVKIPSERLPINQEDLIFTLMLFSVVFLQDLERLKVSHTSQQKEDYLATFRYVGYLIGINDPDLRLASFEKSLALKQSIDMHLIQPNEQSSHMAKVVLKSFHNMPPFYLNYRHLVQINRFLMGEQLSNELGYPYANTGLDWSFYFSFGRHQVQHKILLYLFGSSYLNLLETKVIESYAEILRGPPSYQFKQFDESDDFSVQYPFRLSDYYNYILVLLLIMLVCFFRY